MTQHCFNDSKLYEGSASSSPYPLSSQHRQISSLSHKNIFRLLSWREISPRARYSSKRLHGDAKKFGTDCIGSKCEIIDARLALNSWVEAKSLHHLSAKYCSLVPPPRSTIAAAFSLDGKTLASTHGDHTVKIIDCQTGRCLKVLSGHRRTPWVVRFHPLYSEILASGSLDHEVRLWDANSAVCIGSHDFYRPIASIAFHAQGELLAVASGHKLFIWNYKRDTSSPSIVLKTRRSLRAVHFHPHAAPFLLTAEVNDLDSPDSPLALATSCGYSPYPPPAVFFANINSRLCPHLEANMPLIPSPYLFWPTIVRDDARSSLQLGGRVSSLGNVQQQTDISRQLHANGESQFTNLVTPMEMSPGEPSSTSLSAEDALANSMIAEMETAPLNSYRVGAGTSHVLPTSSEMGAHFSPCGRFFVACVACMLPQVEGDPGLQAHMPHDAAGARASPTRHPISAHQVMYELRVYSLEGATFGKVLASRAIRAAHCLTSIQFSPTSEHILLAYGRRHSSLLRSIIIDEETAIPIYTILEVYRVSDMELVRVLPSAEDEVNVACFHPLVGGGLVYGTKEGKLRILKFDGSQDANCTGTNFFLEESILESQV
ncbi:uncharacterized protein A4U43_C07F20020 [Asparagus officinalis]|uniref:Uncharacterized protein n=1 Tax=Asparagus officinalis TaxID=4686 RepID=A0A5P1EDJ7_ASPOF|nr:uncharacterized protein A4U43_C07F20020 [Asparagus officinalis]